MSKGKEQNDTRAEGRTSSDGNVVGVPDFSTNFSSSVREERKDHSLPPAAAITIGTTGDVLVGMLDELGFYGAARIVQLTYAVPPHVIDITGA